MALLITPAEIAAQTFTIDELLAKLGVPVEKAKAKLAEIAQQYPDLQIPAGIVLEILSTYLTAEKLTDLKFAVASEWLALIQQGKNEISPPDGIELV